MVQKVWIFEMRTDSQFKFFHFFSLTFAKISNISTRHIYNGIVPNFQHGASAMELAHDNEWRSHASKRKWVSGQVACIWAKLLNLCADMSSVLLRNCVREYSNRGHMTFVQLHMQTGIEPHPNLDPDLLSPF